MIDAYVISLDNTRYCNLSESDRRFIRQVRGVYLFDRNEQTRCCELTPSYNLLFLYNDVVLTEEGEALDDVDLDRLRGPFDFDGEDNYVHCRSIERIIERSEPGTVYHHGEVEADPDDENPMETLREYLSCNHVI